MPEDRSRQASPGGPERPQRPARLIQNAPRRAPETGGPATPALGAAPAKTAGLPAAQRRPAAGTPAQGGPAGAARRPAAGQSAPAQPPAGRALMQSAAAGQATPQNVTAGQYAPAQPPAGRAVMQSAAAGQATPHNVTAGQAAPQRPAGAQPLRTLPPAGRPARPANGWGAVGAGPALGQAPAAGPALGQAPAASGQNGAAGPAAGQAPARPPQGAQQPPLAPPPAARQAAQQAAARQAMAQGAAAQAAAQPPAAGHNAASPAAGPAAGPAPGRQPQGAQRPAAAPTSPAGAAQARQTTVPGPLPGTPRAKGGAQSTTGALDLRRALDRGETRTGTRKTAFARRAWRAAGEALYTLGFGFEYFWNKVFRVLRDVGIFIGQLLLWLAAGLVQWLGQLFRSLWRDLAAPLRRFRKKLQQAARARERALRRAAQGAEDRSKVYATLRMKSALAFLMHSAGALLPVLAAVVLVVTVRFVLSTNYALAVDIGGKVLYVADQSVVENAKSLLRDRIRLAPEQDVTDWQLNPTYSLTWQRDYTTTQDLVNEILLNSAEGGAGGLLPATGLYLDNTLYAVTTEGERLQAFLDGMLRQYEDPNDPDAKVSFVRQVACDPGSDEVFFASSVVPYDELIDRLTREVAPQVNHIATGTETMAEIAHEQDITLEQLRQRNPGYIDVADDEAPLAGSSIVVRRAQPFLQVQKSVRRSSVEPIPFTTVEQPNNEKPINYRRAIQAGQNGSQEVWDDYYYVDGELWETVRRDELTVRLTEPVPEIIEVGTFSFGSSMDPTEYNPVYFWPVPDSVWSSRGLTSWHRGQDINADYGTPIYAANAGVVVESGWNWSYGNYLLIEHPDGWRTLYGHCQETIVVAGDTVLQKQLIGYVGSTGVSTGPHLHLEFQDLEGKWYDPLTMVTPPEGYSFGRKPANAGY